MERLAWLIEGVTSGVPSVASAFVFLAFGGAAAWLLGIRSRLLLVVAALPVGIGLLALTSQVVGGLGFQTSIVIQAGVALGVAALLATMRWLRTRKASSVRTTTAPPGPIVWAGAALGSAIAMGVWLAGIGDFGLPPQGNDDIWHGYVVERLIHMPAITADTVAPVFVDSASPVYNYPYGIHLSAALTHEVTPVSVAEILNGAWVVDIGLLLPFGLAALAWRLFPGRPWVAFWSGTLSSGVTVFPYLTVGLLPFTAAVAMIPGLLALVLAYLGQPRVVPSVVVALAAVGILVTHPSGAAAAGVLVGLVTLEQVLLASRRREASPIVRALIVPAALAALGSLPWLLTTGSGGIGTPTASPSPDGPGPAVLMFLGLASPWTPPQPLLAILALAGVVAAIASRHAMSMVAGLAIFGVLFIGVIAGIGSLAGLTGPWLGDWPRLLAVVGLILPILAALGVTGIVRSWRRIMERRALPRASLSLAVTALVVGFVVIGGTSYAAARGQSIVRTAWHDSGLITSQDLGLLKAIAQEVGPTDKVLNSPRDGSVWMYALFGTTPVIPYPVNLPPPWWEIFTGQGFGQSDVACRTIIESGATFAIVKTVPGYVDDFDIAGFVSRNSGLFTVVLRADTGVLYRIDQGALTRCANG